MTAVSGNPTTIDSPTRYATANRDRFLAELKHFVGFPSISAQPNHAGDVRRCANWLASHMRQIGFERVKLFLTPRHPIVFCEWRQDPSRPTVLIYGHYDVQPPEPLDQWHTPPFSATMRGSNLYGRGACDDKGQMFTHIKALESYLKTTRNLPVNVKCIFEGEEEIGSPNLHDWVIRNREALKADVAVMSDTRMLAPDRPAITYALRGGLSLELEVSGLKHDLHSGNFGGAVQDPVHVLCELIHTLHDGCGRVAIEGFYDRVRGVSPAERAYMARNGPSDQEIFQQSGAFADWGEPGFSLYERTTIRPCLTVNGITGGYQGEGVKAVIPSSAIAKLNFRLVHDQDPGEIASLFRRHIDKMTPETVRTRIRVLLAAKPVVLNRNHAGMRAAAAAYKRAFGADPVFLRSSGSIPVVSTFKEALRIPTALMGFALPNDRIHGPNEKFHLPNFYRGIQASIEFLQFMSQEPQ